MAISGGADQSPRKSQNSRCSLQEHTARRPSQVPHRVFSPTAHLKKLGAPDFTAPLTLSAVGTDRHRQKKTAESCFTLKPHHKSLSPFLLAENMSVEAGHRAILAETGAGAETEVRLWSQQKCGWVFGGYSTALGQCLSGSVSMRSAVTSENCI